MNILDQIVETKRVALAETKKRVPLSNLIEECRHMKQPVSLKKSVHVKGELSIIAEMKQKSPSAGQILSSYDPASIAQIYEKAGARGISILTEESYFGGSLEHIAQAKEISQLPILRKDFVFDPYQVYETKAAEASCVLLIAAVLSQPLLLELIDLARELNLDALVEIHDEPELERALNAGADMIGINNRNLKDLTINLDTSFKLRKYIPEAVCVISESGIASPDTITRLRKSWFQGALIGESLLKSQDWESKLRAFVDAGTTSQEAELN